MSDKRFHFKNKIVKFLQQDLDDETVDIIDVFKYTGNQSLQLTYFGFRKLEKHYVFHEIEFSFVYNVTTFSTLTRAIKGLFYYTLDKRDGTIKILTTDAKFVNRIKLCQFDFDHMIKKFKL